MSLSVYGGSKSVQIWNCPTAVANVGQLATVTFGVGGLQRFYDKNETDFPNLEQTGDVAIKGWAG